MEILLIRHGKTPGNLRGAYVGRTDEPLSPEGREALLSFHYERPELIFSSPMKRCLETAAILFPGMEPEVIEDLRECDFGRFEMHTYQELSGDASYQAWIDSGGLSPFPEGESHEGFIKRCQSGFLQALDLCEKKDVDTAAMVIHGGSIMAILDRWSKPHKDYFSWQVKNGCGIRVTCEKDRPSGEELSLTWEIL